MSERSRSRSPIKDAQNIKSVFLYVGNIPKKWNHYNIKQLLKEKINENVVDYIRHVYICKEDERKKNAPPMAYVIFTNKDSCEKANRALQGVEVDGIELEVLKDPKLIRCNRKFIPRVKYFARDSNEEQSGPLPRAGGFGKHETYGLEEKFLNSLGLTPPLINQLYIGNLSQDVTEAKLREIFSYAGTVVAVSIIKKNMPYGKVMFAHPVEAVQAISMFHNQTLYGLPMSVRMDKMPMVILPEGLGGIGKGLGPNGAPLHNIQTVLEIQPLKQLILNELSKIPEKTNMEPNQQNHMSALSINTNVNQNPFGTLMQLLQEKMSENIASMTWSMQQGNDQNQFNQNFSQQTPPTSRFDIPPSGLQQSVFNPLGNMVQNPLANLQNAMGNVGQTLANPTANIEASKPRSRFDIPPSGMPLVGMAQTAMPVTNQSQVWGLGQNAWGQLQDQSKSNHEGNSYGSAPYNPDEFDVERLSDLYKQEAKNSITTSDMLLFQDLPASVTSKALINKMREVGELKYAEITGKGRAVVRFSDPRDAERCVKLYDRSKVDGQVISVKLF